MNYTVIRSNRKTVALQIKNDELIVRAPNRMRDKDIYRFVCEHREWIEKHLEIGAKKVHSETKILSEEQLRALYDRAYEIIPVIVERYAALLGVKYGKITVRCQKTRWGSCSSKGNLSFNCLLMSAPTEVLESVIVHELCHIKHMNHAKKFYEEVLRVYPDYYKHHNWLKENGASLLSQANKNG